MGTTYTLHLETFIDGAWTNWDLYRHQCDDKYKIIPIISGGSFVGDALKRYGLLANRLHRSDIAQQTRDAHPTMYPNDQDWRVFDCKKFFSDKNYLLPENGGFFAKDILNQFRAEGDYELLDSTMACGVAYASPAEYAKMSPQAQKGFEYYEYTSPGGVYDVMRRINEGIHIRTEFVDKMKHTDMRIVILCE